MKLETWLEANRMSINNFAQGIGKDKSSVYRYVYENAIPKIDSMYRIFSFTMESVTANDFYGLPEKSRDAKKTACCTCCICKNLNVDSFR